MNKTEKRAPGAKTSKPRSANKAGNKPVKDGTCTNSLSPDESMERNIEDIIVHESDMAGKVETPYRRIAKYKMVPTSDEGGTFSGQRS